MFILTPSDMEEIETQAIVEFLELRNKFPKEAQQETLFYSMCIVRAGIRYLIETKGEEIYEMMEVQYERNKA